MKKQSILYDIALTISNVSGILSSLSLFLLELAIIINSDVLGKISLCAFCGAAPVFFISMPLAVFVDEHINGKCSQ